MFYFRHYLQETEVVDVYIYPFTAKGVPTFPDLLVVQ